VHAISRVIERRYIFGYEEKQYFCKLLREQAIFSGVRVVTKNVMCTHFHLLLEQVNRKKIAELTWPELEKRLSAIYNDKQVNCLRNKYENLVKIGDPKLIRRFFERYEKRMHDISVFMKELKQKFSQWYNRRNNRKGPLWEDRFKGVIVEGAQNTLLIMAAYIDLNPVRAGMVKRVEDYKWSGYGAAVGGDISSQQGLGIIFDQSHHISGEAFETDWQETSKLYRLWLYQQGRAVLGDRDAGVKGKKGFSDADLEQVIDEQGELSIAESLHYRQQYLSDCKVFGTTEFVEQEYARSRSTPGASSRYGIKKFKTSQWQEYRVM